MACGRESGRRVQLQRPIRGRQPLAASVDGLESDHVTVVGFPSRGGGFVDPVAGTDATGDPVFHAAGELRQALGFAPGSGDSTTEDGGDSPPATSLRSKLATDRRGSPILEAVASSVETIRAADPEDEQNPETGAVVVLSDGQEAPRLSPAVQEDHLRVLRRHQERVHVYVVPVGRPGSLDLAARMARESRGSVLCLAAPAGPTLSERAAARCADRLDDFDDVFTRVVQELGGR